METADIKGLKYFKDIKRRNWKHELGAGILKNDQFEKETKALELKQFTN